MLQNITPTVSTNPTKSYAAAAQTTPTKDQATVIEANEGITIKDSSMAVAQINDPNVRFVSRISNGRVSIYLSTKQIAETLTKKYTKISTNISP
jgi:hypothetical protein